VHTQQVSLAEGQLEMIRAAHRKLMEANDQYKANLVNIQALSGEAWIKLSRGDPEGALEMMREAAEMEDRTEKHPVTPGELVPARELLAEMYQEVNDHEKALEAFDLDLMKHPNRFAALTGAARSAEKLGRREKAASYYRQLLAVAEGSHSARKALTRARAFQ
jgi:tetratricopeptide (TPR) repeat protein